MCACVGVCVCAMYYEENIINKHKNWGYHRELGMPRSQFTKYYRFVLMKSYLVEICYFTSYVFGEKNSHWDTHEIWYSWYGVLAPTDLFKANRWPWRSCSWKIITQCHNQFFVNYLWNMKWCLHLMIKRFWIKRSFLQV